MLPQKTLEYLIQLTLIVLVLKLTEGATFNIQPGQQLRQQYTEDSTIATPTAKEDATIVRPDTMRRAFGECDTELSWMCLKIEFVKLMERLTERAEINLMPGISVVKDANATEQKTTEMMAEIARSYPNDPSSRLNGYIVSKLQSFLKSHYLRFKLTDAAIATEAHTDVATGRKGKFGKKGGVEAFIAAGLMMKGTLMAIGMGAIALMAGKALMTALMALTLSGVLGLKTLAGGGSKSTTYEIVAKPIYTSSHSHSVSHEDGHAHGGHYSAGHSGSGYGGYARSFKIELPTHLQKPKA